jgi:two-component system chemotaxis response regulator CheY
MTENASKKQIADQIGALTVLVVDDNQYMRKMIRNLLVNCGIKDIYEANDGIAALDAIRTMAPDVVILDWEMPLLSGAELVRISAATASAGASSRRCGSVSTNI